MDAKLDASISEFAVRFCNEIDKGSSSVCSPVSAQALLALTALGCAGASRAELLRAMHLTDDDHIRSTFSYFKSSLNSIEGVSLRIANKVYVKKHGTLKPAIQKDAEEVFDSALEQIDFKKTEAATAIINKWVAEQTAGKIHDIITPGLLVPDTELLLVNAIYFQGLWEYQFAKNLTRERAFYVNDGTVINVPMMYKADTHFFYKYSPDLKARLLRLDYVGRQAGLVIVLPDEVEGLGDVMQQLAAGHDLMDEIAGLQDTKLDVIIPKFKIETTIDLKTFLPNLGIKSIFNEEKSDIRMLTSNKRLYVYQAMQKAVIEVDEAGTKAAACTVFAKRLCCRRPNLEKQRFKADRPFLYLLVARQIPLFLGTYHGNLFAVPDRIDDSLRYFSI